MPVSDSIDDKAPQDFSWVFNSEGELYVQRSSLRTHRRPWVIAPETDYSRSLTAYSWDLATSDIPCEFSILVFVATD